MVFFSIVALGALLLCSLCGLEIECPSKFVFRALVLTKLSVTMMFHIGSTHENIIWGPFRKKKIKSPSLSFFSKTRMRNMYYFLLGFISFSIRINHRIGRTLTPPCIMAPSAKEQKLGPVRSLPNSTSKLTE